jgi:predicted ATPase
MISTLSQYAPSWLVQMPGHLSADQAQALRNRVQGTTQARMLGEFCEALETFTNERPFILGLDDLQWTDFATLDLLSIIARRAHRARLMVVGTYRPADVIVLGHLLRKVLQDLRAHRQCTEIWPDYLTEAGVETYLANRFPSHDFPTNLPQEIHRNTAGNPLFVTAFADELLYDKSIDDSGGRWRFNGDARKLEAGKSSSLRQLIEGQLSRLAPGEQRLLEVAALISGEFSSDLVANALESDPAEIEELADALVRRRQILRTTESSAPPQSTYSRYEFLHDLYRGVAFERSSRSRRRHRYKMIADKLVSDFAGRLDEVATQLAFYFRARESAARGY